MNIGIIGTGNVGRVLGSRWARKGHQVVFGTRDPNNSKIRALLETAGPTARADTVERAVAASDPVLLAIPWAAVQETIQAVGNFDGKMVVDCTNPLAPNLRELTVGHTTSAGEQVASWAKGARVVKAFNMTGAKNMADPLYGSQKATMFICGDDAEAKSVVARLAQELGFDVIDTGSLTMARYLEPLAMLWIHLAYHQGFGPDVAFKLLKR